MRDRITCCKDCVEERHPGCGATCKEYKKQKAELEETKAIIKRKREADTYIIEFKEKTADMRVKKTRRTGGYNTYHKT